MYAKKGQVAVFVIVAIVIVLGILLGVFARSGVRDFNDPTKLDVKDRIVYELKNCIDEQLGTAVQIVGLQGGHLLGNPKFIDTSIGGIVIVYSGDNDLLSISQIEDEISGYLEKIIPLCLEEDNYKFDFDYETRNIRTTIKSNEIESLARIYVTLGEDGSSKTIDFSHKAIMESNFKDIYDAASSIVVAHSKDPEYVDISLLSEYDYDISFIPVDNYRIYIITDEVNYSFAFGVEK